MCVHIGCCLRGYLTMRRHVLRGEIVLEPITQVLGALLRAIDQDEVCVVRVELAALSASCGLARRYAWSPPSLKLFSTRSSRASACALEFFLALWWLEP